VDGQPAATGQEFWVRAGPHVVELVAADGSSTRHDTTVTAGETELVGHHSPPARSGNGLSLTWFTVGASLTAVSAAVLIWSGVDTLAQNDDFQAAPTVGKDANGRAAELRTNVLIGVTAGLAVATASLAAFTNWGTADEEEQGLAPTVSLKWTGAGAALSLDGAF